MRPVVTVADYDIGNIHSVVKALRHVGAEVVLTGDAAEAGRAERLVVPGVGAFADAMGKLRDRGLDTVIVAHAERGDPLLGICIGMQVLLSESTEFGHHRGLGIIDGQVLALEPETGIKIPQIGWNTIHPAAAGEWRHPMFVDLPPEPMVSFVHSFTAVPTSESDRLADADYGSQRVSAAVARNNVVGLQFHPEKSGEVGLEMLRRFIAA